MHRNSGWAGHAYMIGAGALVGFALILQFSLTANLVVAQGGHLVTAMHCPTGSTRCFGPR
jgi:hypothetical protein